MLDLLKRIFAGQNQFASGGLLLMIVGGLSVYLRAVPEKLWEWIVSQTTMMVTVTDDDAAFIWVKEWFLDQHFLKRVRRVDLDTTLRSERIAMIPAPGCHWFWYAGRPFQVWFWRTESSFERSTRRVESLTFRTIGRKQSFLKNFVDDVVRSHFNRLGVQSRLYTYNDGWDYCEAYAPRLLESVVLQAGEKQHLVQDIANFRKARQRYLSLGVPYHRGYLFYGPPGTGKTSLVSAIAANFGLSLYCLNLADFNDRSLMAAVNQIPANSVLLFEDIDCMKSGQARVASSGRAVGEGASAAAAPSTKDQAQDTAKATKESAATNTVTLSGLLNVLDGFFAPTGVLFMMTTNHIEALDAALLRPGRIDYRLYLGAASSSQKLELYRRFFPQAPESDAREIVEACPLAQTMAEFQGLLLAMAEDSAGFRVADANPPSNPRKQEERDLAIRL